MDTLKIGDKVFARSRVTLSPGPDVPAGVSADDDPFLGLIRQFEGLIADLRRRADKHEVAAKKRWLQIRRLERIVRMLDAPESPNSKKSGGHGWSLEQRAAQAERMRKRNAERGKREAAAGTDESN